LWFSFTFNGLEQHTIVGAIGCCHLKVALKGYPASGYTSGAIGAIGVIGVTPLDLVAEWVAANLLAG
jgi:hypothetical protein